MGSLKGSKGHVPTGREMNSDPFESVCVFFLPQVKKFNDRIGIQMGNEIHSGNCANIVSIELRLDGLFCHDMSQML